ncbi:lim and transglutaminase domain protein ltd-1-like [Neoarius graeffei]|uniref:lim and transglutaminase domain protein ltd-1-like n=1 Tax=Neoarius graeffei TaxID=443677 RepID=UPI00298BCBA4|nr:lim and transglutaminase domain protein ltd-1-like [Neoarius graeffei]
MSAQLRELMERIVACCLRTCPWFQEKPEPVRDVQVIGTQQSVPVSPVSPPPPTARLYTAVRDYTARTAEHLSFRAGDQLQVLDQSSPDWWIARLLTGTSTHSQGYIPSSSVVPLESLHEERSERSSKTQGKGDETKTSQRHPCSSPVFPKNSTNKNRTYQTTPKPDISTKSSVFEKWATMDKANQKPLVKKQFSEINKSFTCRAEKNSSLVNDKDQTREKVQSRAIQQDKRNDQIILNQHGSRRKLKELISSTDDFYRVDTHAIRAGQELKSKKIFSVQTIARTITKGTSTDLEKLRAIWIWLCHNIEYDVNGYLGLTEKVCSPERTIETGRGVCSGYSSLCLQLCKEVGIECKKVNGHGKGVGYKLGQSYQSTKSNHSWNAVRLEDHWYLLDACWGAGVVDMENKTFIKRYNEFYFLTDPEDFIDSHWPDEEEWQLLDSPITLEEFEKSVPKDTEFYKLGLNLIHPKQFLLVTEDGEASISLGFSQPVDFTYKISQHHSSGQKELSTSMGQLTATQNSMKLRLMPPSSGTFEIELFARPGHASGSLSWVCSFLLECYEPKTSENFPENPYLYWGLTPNAEDLGVKSCVYDGEAFLLKSGSYELVLQTSRPLEMLCEISHKDLDDTLSKRCLATQIEAEKLTCHILCPYIGYYRLSVFVMDYESDRNSFQNVGNFLLHCIANPVNLNQLFPPDLSHFCGPGIRTDDAGLSKFSHTAAIVSTQQGKCNITFQNPRDLDLYAILKHGKEESGHSLSQYVFFTHNGDKVTLSVALPEPGVYKLSLYGKTPSNQKYNLLCDFILQNSSESSWPPFPYTYADWRKGSVLFEPRSGLLEPLCWVQFRVCVPGAHRVTVLAEQRVDLQINKSHIWEGEVFTGNVEQIKLAAIQEETSNRMNFLMRFDVLKPQNEM